jgi:transcription termination/antitermination protein NusG
LVGEVRVIENPHNSSQMSDEAAHAPHPVVPPAEPPKDAAEAPAPPAASADAPSAETAPEMHAESSAAPASEPASAEPVADEPVAEETVSQQPADDEPVAEGVAIEEETIEEEEVEPRGPIEETPVSEQPPQMDWFILKVQSNREESIRESLLRRVKVAGLERFFGEIIVPTEMVSEFKGGKKRVVKRKLYPGYLVAHMEINDETWFLVRETPGIGDFTGSAGKPTPMQPHEVAKIVAKQEEKTDEAPKLKINFNVSDRVKINEGTFENFEGEVDSIDEASGRVTVMINIFGRSTPVELEYWQIESI